MTAPRSWCRTTTSRLTYAQLAAAVEETAAALRALGVGRGDRVAFALPGGPEIIELLLAVASLGPAAAPLNPAYAQSEFAFYLEDLRPRLLVLPARRPRTGAGGGGRGRAGRRPGGAARDRRRRSRAPRARRRRPTRHGPTTSRSLLHTSGTTSRPKQVPLRHRNLLASARSIARHYALGPEDVSYCAMPLFHVHGIVASTLAPLVSGGTVVAPRRVAPQPLLARARRGPASPGTARARRFHEMLLDGAPDEVPRGRAAALRPLVQSPPSARPSRTAWRSTSACRCWRPTA